jgi:raffinose/stachyose/melibiose transport system substrate-binding protein
MFQKAGITKTPKTFDELLDVCDKLKKAGFIPITTQANAWPVLRYLAMIPFRLDGNNYILNACSGKGSFGDPPGIKSAEYLQKLSQYFETGFASVDYDSMVDLFTGNKAAILYNGTWCLADLNDDNNNLKPEYGTFTMPMYSEHDVTAPTDFFTNSGIGTAIRKDALTPEMKEFLSYLFERYPDVALNDYHILPSLMPTNMDGISQTYKQVLTDVMNCKNYTRCWDVVINQASLDTLNKETTLLALNLITPTEWATVLDKSISENSER